MFAKAGPGDEQSIKEWAPSPQLTLQRPRCASFEPLPSSAPVLARSRAVAGQGKSESPYFAAAVRDLRVPAFLSNLRSG